MSQQVVLKLGQGNWYQGFSNVIIQLANAQGQAVTQWTASLAAAPELSATYTEWRSLYLALYQRLHLRRLTNPYSMRSEIEIEPEGITNISDVALQQLGQHLKQQLDQWLETNSFSRAERQLRTLLSPSEEIRVIVETQEAALRRFPWQLWSFFEDYPKAEVALSATEYGKVDGQDRPKRQRIRILAILGNSTGIDTQQDRQTLEALPDAEIVFLVEPTRPVLDQSLWSEEGWDILCFAGHSTSDIQGLAGLIAINPVEQLTIAQLKNGMKAAIARGLKLAIFNSCDGLGLARALADLHLPQLIVMREPIPDLIAQEFLKQFLKSFAKGSSFYAAVREAREKLQGFENQFPCAAWLPLICQNPAELPPTWATLRAASVPDSPQGLTPQFSGLPPSIPPSPGLTASPSTVSSPSIASSQTRTSNPSTPPIGEPGALLTDQPASQPPAAATGFADANRQREAPTAKVPARWRNSAIASLAATLLVMGLRVIGGLQGIELAAFDQLIRSRPMDEGIDPNILVVETTEADTNQYNYPLRDETLAKLLATIADAQPVAIGLDMHRYLPRERGREQLIEQFRRHDNLFTVCKFNSTDVNHAPPPELTPEQQELQMGFSNLIGDGGSYPSSSLGDRAVDEAQIAVSEKEEGIVRRQLLSHDPTQTTQSSPCITPYSLSFQLAYRFLRKQPQIHPPEVTSAGDWRFGSALFQKLPSRFGGYQDLDGMSAQVMLNYRSDAPGQRVTMGDVLRGKVDGNLIKNRIVLIGTTAPIGDDYLKTPYGAMAGVWIHAHQVSQMINAATSGRSLIWVLPSWQGIQWGDALWVLGWAGLGSGIAGLFKSWRSPSWRSLSLRSMGWFAIANGISLILLYYISLLALVQGGWLPLVPSGLAMLGASLGALLKQSAIGGKSLNQGENRPSRNRLLL